MDESTCGRNYHDVLGMPSAARISWSASSRGQTLSCRSGSRGLARQSSPSLLSGPPRKSKAIASIPFTSPARFRSPQFGRCRMAWQRGLEVSETLRLRTSAVVCKHPIISTPSRPFGLADFKWRERRLAAPTFTGAVQEHVQVRFTGHLDRLGRHACQILGLVRLHPCQATGSTDLNSASKPPLFTRDHRCLES